MFTLLSRWGYIVLNLFGGILFLYKPWGLEILIIQTLGLHVYHWPKNHEFFGDCEGFVG